VQFLLKWKGYPLDEASWEPEENVKNSPDLIADFYRKHPNAIKSKRIKGSIFDSEEFKQWHARNIHPSIVRMDTHSKKGVMS